MSHKFLSNERIVDSSDDLGSDRSQDEEEEEKEEKSASDSDTNSSSSPSVNGASSHKRKSPFRVENTAKRHKTATTAREPKAQTGNKNIVEGHGSDSNTTRSSRESSSGSYETAADNTPSSPELNGNAPRTPESSSPTSKSNQNISAPWEPPSGFQTAPDASQSSASVSDRFSADFLVGKELWHITAPISVPIDSLSEVSLDQLNRGEAFLSHGGLNYTLNMDAPQQSRTSLPLIPSEDGITYRTTQMHFTKTLRLQNVTQPQIHIQNDAPITSRSTIIQHKQPRQQPDGLRTRFWPAGFEDKNREDAVAGPEDNDSVNVSSDESSESSSASSESSQDGSTSSGSTSVKQSTKQSDDQTSSKSALESSESSESSDSSESSSVASSTSSASEESSSSDDSSGSEDDSFVDS